MHASLCSTHLHSLSRGLLTPLSGGAGFSHQVIDLQLRLEAGLIRRPLIPRKESDSSRRVSEGGSAGSSSSSRQALFASTSTRSALNRVRAPAGWRSSPASLSR